MEKAVFSAMQTIALIAIYGTISILSPKIAIHALPVALSATKTIVLNVTTDIF